MNPIEESIYQYINNIIEISDDSIGETVPS